MERISVLELQERNFEPKSAELEGSNIYLTDKKGERILLRENRTEIINLARDHPLPRLIVGLLPTKKE